MKEDHNDPEAEFSVVQPFDGLASFMELLIVGAGNLV